MLDEYPFERTKDGVPFHRKFSSMGLESDVADKVSFVELLDVVTIGIKSKAREQYRSLANTKHLDYLRSLFTDGAARTIFISSTVLKDLEFLDGKRWGLLNLTRKIPIRTENGLPLIYERDKVKVYRATHFSGSISTEELKNIRSLVLSSIGH